MTTKPSPLVLVLGHSFVRRLETFVVLSPLPCVSPNFLLPVSSPVHFYGVGGRTVTKLRQLDLAVVARCRPTLLILDIGSNDLCNPFCNVHDLRNNIICLVETFHFRYHVTHIIVGQILPRLSPPAIFPPYNSQVQQLNHELSRFFKHTSFASFWWHPQVLRSKSSVFLKDGVHLNREGNHLLYHSYQKALLRYFSCNMQGRPRSPPLVSFKPPCQPRRNGRRRRRTIRTSRY